jgi:hypothetical protein
MPVARFKQDTTIAEEMWRRYAFMRDNGHADFVTKAEKCDSFFLGKQWDEKVKKQLDRQRRPALTINKILATIGTLMGDQIQNRTEIAFRAKRPGFDPVAAALIKLFKHISDDNQLDWLRAEVFADGIITSRGFYDVRLKFDDNLMGEVGIELLNPKNVLIDPTAEDFDPRKWMDVITTKWYSLIEIENTWGKDAAKELKGAIQSGGLYNADVIESQRDRFGSPTARGWYDSNDNPQSRLVRVIERQYRETTRQEHFVDLTTGDIRPVPETWDRDRIAAVVEQYQFAVVPRDTTRIRWCTVAGSLVLHHEWSPYKNMTVVPYFPYARRGRTMGLVENLLDPQEILNKVSSQELHVVNTTANSGWKVKAGALTNMSLRDLEERGAETGLVIETNGDPDKDLVKIQPNQYPTGLDRASYKAEEHIKTISMVTDTMMGNDREDVAAKAITAKQGRSAAVHAKPLDNLARSDFFLARAILDIVQEFYSEPRVYNIVTDRLTGAATPVGFNQPDPATGEIVNDLTLGEFHVIVTATPAREAFEDSQFEQAVQLRELLGDQVPATVLVKNSRLLDRGEIIQQMEAQANSPEAQEQQAVQMELLRTELAKAQADVAKTQADAEQRVAKAEAQVADMKRKIAETSHKMATDTPEVRQQESEQQMAMDRERHAMTMQQETEKHALDMQTKQNDSMAKAQEAQLGLDATQQQHQMNLQHQQEVHAQRIAQQKTTLTEKKGSSDE